jgi:RNA polymerase sigma-70 factor (family 1)
MGGINQIDFENIFNTWYGPIRNFIYYKSGDKQTAEDIAQDTFLKVWEKKETIKSETVKSLVYTIANNLFLNQVEHQKVHLKFAVKFQPNDIVKENPEFEMQVKEFDLKLQKAINELDDKKRTVFLMNRIEKYTYNQIAENLGITVKAVEKRMEKALAYIRKEIEMNV